MMPLLNTDFNFVINVFNSHTVIHSLLNMALFIKSLPKRCVCVCVSTNRMTLNAIKATLITGLQLDAGSAEQA